MDIYLKNFTKIYRVRLMKLNKTRPWDRLLKWLVPANMKKRQPLALNKRVGTKSPTCTFCILRLSEKNHITPQLRQTHHSSSSHLWNSPQTKTIFEKNKNNHGSNFEGSVCSSCETRPENNLHRGSCSPSWKRRRRKRWRWDWSQEAR